MRIRLLQREYSVDDDCFRCDLFGKYRFLVTSNATKSHSDKGFVASSGGSSSRSIQLNPRFEKKQRGNWEKTTWIGWLFYFFREMQHKSHNSSDASRDRKCQYMIMIQGRLGYVIKSWKDLFVQDSYENYTTIEYESLRLRYSLMEDQLLSASEKEDLRDYLCKRLFWKWIYQDSSMKTQITDNVDATWKNEMKIPRAGC